MDAIERIRQATPVEFVKAACEAAPVLLARIAELEAQLEAARVAVAKWHSSYHDNLCYAEWPKSANPPHGGQCNCGSFDNNRNRLAARRAVGLEVRE